MTGEIPRPVLVLIALLTYGLACGTSREFEVEENESIMLTIASTAGLTEAAGLDQA